MRLTLLLFICVLFFKNTIAQKSTFKDTVFLQEYHQSYRPGHEAKENDVRSIAVDKEGNVWVATAAGVRVKKKTGTSWTSPFASFDEGPSFVVLADKEGTMWMGNWQGIYIFRDNKLRLLKGTDGPVSVMCDSQEGVYAAGPKGIWLCKGTRVEKKQYFKRYVAIAR